jgi:hypothetical protein
MMTMNTSNITGDKNVVLQDITARDVIINIANDLPPDVKLKKQSLKAMVDTMVEELSQLSEQYAADPAPTGELELPDDPAYASVKWRKLMQALRHDGCVLFIGPEISVDDQGRSLHRSFYKELTEDFDDIEYIENEGFFTPDADEEILYDVLDYYSKVFPGKNQSGRQLLEQLAQVPFNLIISLCPDDTIQQIYNDYDLDHIFLAHDGTRQQVDEVEVPIIYNILGNAASNGRYIFTHENFYHYLSKVSIPAGIKKRIQDATHLLFIGFDFDKWYNRLLLFILDFEQKKGGGSRMIVGNKTIRRDIELFIEKQFNITFVDNAFAPFVQWLAQNAAQEGILRNLNQTFLQNNFRKLQTISNKISDEDKLEELAAIEAQAVSVGQKIAQFKKHAKP